MPVKEGFGFRRVLLAFFAIIVVLSAFVLPWPMAFGRPLQAAPAAQPAASATLAERFGVASSQLELMTQRPSPRNSMLSRTQASHGCGVVSPG